MTSPLGPSFTAGPAFHLTSHVTSNFKKNGATFFQKNRRPMKRKRTRQDFWSLGKKSADDRRGGPWCISGPFISGRQSERRSICAVSQRQPVGVGAGERALRYIVRFHFEIQSSGGCRRQFASGMSFNQLGWKIDCPPARRRALAVIRY